MAQNFGGYREDTLQTWRETAISTGRITQTDNDLITRYVREAAAKRGISTARRHLMTKTLIRWRDWIPHGYTQCSDIDLQDGLVALNCEDLSQNTKVTYRHILKQFLKWLIKRGECAVSLDELNDVKLGKINRMTKTTKSILTETEVHQIIEATTTLRDRCLLSILYESACRVGEIATLTWDQVKFDEYGCSINVDEKTGRPRYIRVSVYAPTLAAWHAQCPTNVGNLVFPSRYNTMMTYGTVRKVLDKAVKIAGITKRVHPHLFRHSRITHLLQHRVPESVVKKMGWGRLDATMIETYGHLVDQDTDAAILELAGVEQAPIAKPVIGVVICPHCFTRNEPRADAARQHCYVCGRALSDDALTRDEQIESEIDRIMNDTTFRNAILKLFSDAKGI
jgi:integrase